MWSFPRPSEKWNRELVRVKARSSWNHYRLTQAARQLRMQISHDFSHRHYFLVLSRFLSETIRKIFVSFIIRLKVMDLILPGDSYKCPIQHKEQHLDSKEVAYWHSKATLLKLSGKIICIWLMWEGYCVPNKQMLKTVKPLWICHSST